MFLLIKNKPCWKAARHAHSHGKGVHPLASVRVRRPRAPPPLALRGPCPWSSTGPISHGLADARTRSFDRKQPPPHEGPIVAAGTVACGVRRAWRPPMGCPLGRSGQGAVLTLSPGASSRRRFRATGSPSVVQGKTFAATAALLAVQVVNPRWASCRKRFKKEKKKKRKERRRNKK
jgi:hypothetical protein